jgi:Lambda phage tail tape-measure protein (Tape_meas_lam_C)
MARATTIKIRVEAENADAVRKALESCGVAGQAAMKKLEAAARSARPEAKALAAVSDDLKNGFAGLGREIPGLSSGLRALGGLGTVVAGGLGLVAAAAAKGFAAANEYMTWAADLTDAADAVQTNVENLQAWRFAMEEVGGQAEDLDSGLAGLNSTIGAIKTGLGDAKAEAALLELGLDPKVVQSWTSLDQALPAIIKGFENVKDEAARVKLAEQLQIEALLPLLRLGADGFDDVTKSAGDLGVVVDRDVVKALDDANRRLEVSAQRMRSEAAPAAVFFADMLGAIGEKAAWSVGKVFDLIAAIGRADRSAQTMQQQVASGARIVAVTFASTVAGPAAGAGVNAALGGNAARRPTKGGRGGGGGGSAAIDSVIEGNRIRNSPPPPSSAYVRRTPAASPPPSRAAARAPQSSASSGPSRAQLEGQRAAAETARKAIADAAEAVRRAEVNARAIDRADMEIVRGREALAAQGDARRAISQEALDLERRQALAALRADKDLDDIAKSRAALAIELAHQVGTARLATEFKADIKDAREKSQAIYDREVAALNDAEMSLAQSAADQATTREESLAAELRILELVKARQLAEIEAMEITEEAKIVARAALNVAAGVRGDQTRTRHASPLAAYADQMKRERENINDALEDIAVGGLRKMEDGLMSIMDGTKSVSEAFSDMARDILAEITRLAIRQWVIAPLMQMMGLNVGGPSGGGGQSSGGSNPLLAAVTSFFGGSKKGGGAGPFSTIFKGGASTGARMQPGDLRIVGERGPEQFVADRAGMIVPNGGGGFKVNIINPQSTPRVSQRADGSLDIIFERLNEVSGRVDTLDRTVETRAMGAFGDARRRGRI